MLQQVRDTLFFPPTMVCCQAAIKPVRRDDKRSRCVGGFSGLRLYMQGQQRRTRQQKVVGVGWGWKLSEPSLCSSTFAGEDRHTYKQ